jgi:hypothetical protein
MDATASRPPNQHYSKLHFIPEFANYYLEAIEKNMAYLSKVIALNDAEYLTMLKRGGIVKKCQALDMSH